MFLWQRPWLSIRFIRQFQRNFYHLLTQMNWRGNVGKTRYALVMCFAKAALVSSWCIYLHQTFGVRFSGLYMLCFGWIFYFILEEHSPSSSSVCQEKKSGTRLSQGLALMLRSIWLLQVCWTSSLMCQYYCYQSLWFGIWKWIWRKSLVSQLCD